MWLLIHPYSSIAVVAIAAMLDFLIGDPWNWLHPVQVMGGFIHQYTRMVLKGIKTPWKLRFAGLGLWVVTVMGSATVAGGLVLLAEGVHPVGGLLISIIILASCFAGRSLRYAAQEVLVPLEQGDLEAARAKLSLYVGRDTDSLDEAGIYRAVFETATENATDGVLVPLFYAVVGALVAGWWDDEVVSGSMSGCVVGAIAYKASSTLDSMVGYRSAPYADLGFFSAKLDDILTWIPCRLTVLTIGLLSGNPRQVWHICRRDAPKDPSPNAGWSECVYAAALNVQVGGINIYRGEVKEKPKLGDPVDPITQEKIMAALRLTRWAFLIWLGLGGVLILAIY